MAELDVSIIIVNYNTCAMTSECIGSIYEHTKDVSFEIILVDNASTDKSKDIFSKDSRIKYIYLDYNSGFGTANNIGVSKAQGKYVFFLNSDTLLLNNAIYLLKRHFDNCKGVGAIGCTLLDKSHNPIHSAGTFITIRSELKKSLRKYLEKMGLLKIKSHKPVYKYPYKVDYITGADLFMRRDIFNMIGGFDPKFFMYCEEVDLQERLNARGLDRLIIEGPKIIHLEGASDSGCRKLWSAKKYHNILVSKNYYISKRNNKHQTFIFQLLNSLILIPGIMIRKETLRNKIMIIKGALGLSSPIIE